MTMAAGLGSLTDDDYTKNNCKEIICVRENTVCELKKLGFTMTDSSANFIFARHSKADGEKFYLELKKKGVLVRHFATEKLCNYNRITVGSEEQMKIFIEKLTEVLEEIL